MYHLLTFYKQKPWAFLVGVVLSPYYLLSKLAYPPEIHVEMVLNGISGLWSYWETPDAVPPPKFVRKRFLALESELLAV